MEDRAPVEHIAPVIPLFRHPKRQSATDLPVSDRPVSCFICVHALITTGGTRCTLYAELIDAEFTVAADCDTYEDDPAKE